jgi:hypothetical protein
VLRNYRTVLLGGIDIATAFRSDFTDAGTHLFFRRSRASLGIEGKIFKSH